MFRITATLLFLSMSIFLFSQEIVRKQYTPRKAIKLFEKAEKCFQKNQYLDGIEKLEEAVALAPGFLDAHIKLGGSYYTRKDYKNAVSAFHSAYNLDTTNHKVLQSLALSHEAAENYPEAYLYFTKFKTNAPNIKSEYLQQINKKLADFKFREYAFANVVPFDPQPLPITINKPNYSEYSPSLTADGNRLFFTRVTGNQEDIYYTEKDTAGTWSEAVLLPKLNTLENEGAHNISADGKTILFTFCSNKSAGQYRGCNIYVSFKRNGRWSTPAYFDAINSKAWDTQPNISSDGKTIIFVSSRPGGKGASDLWTSVRNADGKWTAPRNLSSINTKLREESPFLHADGKTLFFKSEGHPGMGSFDLFSSKLGPDGKWLPPVNLGYPINTDQHEGSMVVSLDGKTAYYSRGNGEVKFDRNKTDIFTFELPESVRAAPVGFVSIDVLDSETSLPISASVNIQSSSGDVRKFTTDNEGGILVTMPLGRDYSLNIDKENYYFHSERFELAAINSAETAFEIKVFLRPIKKEIVNAEEPIILKNVLFETASFDLLAESFFELDQLADLLSTNEDISIEIRGHTDDVGELTDNQVLSENRAKAVRDYLVDKGISQERMSFIGFGESEPIASNESKEGRKINRRTEFIIKQ